MSRKVIGYFQDNGQARQALLELKDKGFNEISILANEKGDETGNRDIGTSSSNLTSAAMINTGLGGLAGLALGAGAMVVPGIGPILAIGPLAIAAAGAVTGGLAGALADYGIPEDRSLFFESKVREGNTVMVLKTDDNLTDEAVRLMRNFGARKVTVH